MQGISASMALLNEAESSNSEDVKFCLLCN